MSTNSRRYLRGLFAIDAIVRRTPDDAWDNPSPCERWTAREVLGHVLWIMHSMSDQMAGGDPHPQTPEAAMAGPDPVASWDAALARVHEAFDTQGALQKTLPAFGGVTVDDLSMRLGIDAVVHAWDLGTAVGLAHGIADDLAAEALAMLGGIPDDQRSPEFMQPATAVAGDAPVADRMAAAAGRSLS